MPILNNLSEKNLFGMKTDILEKKDVGLTGIGLLVILLYNHDKDIDELLNELPDDKNIFEAALQKLVDKGYVCLNKEDGEEIIRVSDIPEFLED